MTGTVTTGPAVLSRMMLGDRLVEYELRSRVLDGPTRLRILFPHGYGHDPQVRYPVLYLLHGGDDDYRSWTDEGQATESTEDMPFIVVMPHAGNGFYSDWVKPGRYGRVRWETFHIGELLPWIDRTFRTVAHRSGRALAGLSMGGFGAMSYAARHPDLFTAAASFSGALDTNRYTFVPEIAARRDGGPIGAIWGDRITQSVRWRAHNPWDLAPNLRGMSLTVRTGTGLPGPLNERAKPDPLEAIVFHESMRLHRRLERLGIKHDWHYGHGTHNWSYWSKDLRATLPTIADVFANPTTTPTPFTHVSAEDDYRVRGWSVHFRRPRMEFSTLANAHCGGFTLIGSGTATVRTAGWFEPDREHKIAVDGPYDQRTVVVRADPAGRLALSLRLGPSGHGRRHTVQVSISEGT
ncbi:hypothetical protein ALI144C_20430 [Actinosynnema sp. ALI-1.44]|uniref:alpha/beta hydrolase n=1 Tax=Actinosynnema sp. ALI-1.44 TaxID=1933779 RepID=UPI00097C8342|nr:alpha/beta hydrolase family protein [Actinosynnema sp. ALI-1.44]ONI81660.1 hypothetical protein ALI144C_20430 [Actinosynnema sp. ALI-1.44]